MRGTSAGLFEVFLVAASIGAGPALAASSLHTLYDFRGYPNGSGPMGNIAIDAAGGVVGSTPANLVPDYGVTYRLAPPQAGQVAWTYNVLWHFMPGHLGLDPVGGPIVGSNGVIYGTTSFNRAEIPAVCGNSYALQQQGATWQATAISNFGKTAQSCVPYDNLAAGPDGALYGTTSNGGIYGDIFRLVPPAGHDPRWRQQVIYSFLGQQDGYYPFTPLAVDGSGTLYGTAIGSANDGPAMAPLYQLTPPQAGQTKWSFSLIWRFAPTDCSDIFGPLTLDAAGAIYGTCQDQANGGVFRLSPPAAGQSNWTETILWRFTGGADGAGPVWGATFDKNGDLYGTTAQNDGTVFRLYRSAHASTGWQAETLWRFSGTDGMQPSSPLVIGNGGNFFGTTTYGGKYGIGTIFRFHS